MRYMQKGVDFIRRPPGGRDVFIYNESGLNLPQIGIGFRCANQENYRVYYFN